MELGVDSIYTGSKTNSSHVTCVFQVISVDPTFCPRVEKYGWEIVGTCCREGSIMTFTIIAMNPMYPDGQQVKVMAFIFDDMAFFVFSTSLTFLALWFLFVCLFMQLLNDADWDRRKQIQLCRGGLLIQPGCQKWYKY